MQNFVALTLFVPLIKQSETEAPIAQTVINTIRTAMRAEKKIFNRVFN